MGKQKRVLVLGSGPDAERIRAWPQALLQASFDYIVAINNAWMLTRFWTHHISPEDFPVNRHPTSIHSDQTRIGYEVYVPIQNRFGGFVYAGGTMAFTAGYFALGAFEPSLIAFLGCDMTYPTSGKTHFYGKGTADPLRQDVTLQNLEGKSARLQYHALANGSVCINISSQAESRLVFPKYDIHKVSNIDLSDLRDSLNCKTKQESADNAQTEEARLAYFVESGEYWKVQHEFDAQALLTIDKLWLDSVIEV